LPEAKRTIAVSAGFPLLGVVDAHIHRVLKPIPQSAKTWIAVENGNASPVVQADSLWIYQRVHWPRFSQAVINPQPFPSGLDGPVSVVMKRNPMAFVAPNLAGGEARAIPKNLDFHQSSSALRRVDSNPDWPSR
jgi:hypothetical protein